MKAKPPFPCFTGMLAAGGDRRMTYINAFRCRDGVVMSADTEESWADYKNYVEKLSIIEDRSYPLAIGGAGIADLIEPMVQEVLEKASERKPSTANELAALLKEAIEVVYNLDLPWLAVKKQERTPEFLIAAKPAGEGPCIFRIKGRRLFRVRDLHIIGYGNPVNFALMKRMFRDNLPMQQAVMLAVYLVSQSKKLDDGVGGDTSVVVVRDNGAWFDYPPYISNSEGRIAEFLKLTDDLFLSSVDISIPPSTFPEVLKKLASDVAELRQKYLNQTASISLSRTLTEPMYAGEPYAKIFPGAVVEFGTRGINARETTPEETERNRMMWEAAKDGNNRLALAQFNELIRDKPVEYLGEETVQVKGSAGLIADKEESGI